MRLNKDKTSWVERLMAKIVDVEMRTIYYVIGIFAVFNFALGYLFQVSRNEICYTELFILVFGGSFFWMMLVRPLIKFSNWVLNNDWNKLAIISTFIGIGSLALFFNLLFAQLAVTLIIEYWLHIQTPGSDTIIASLTNNIGINIFCFASIIGICVYQYKTDYLNAIILEHKDKPEDKDKFMMINHGSSLVKLDFDDIIDIESSQNCITIHTADKKYVKYQSLKSFLNECGCSSFRRIHRSYAVNTKHVSHVKTNDNGDGKVFLKGGKILKLSRTFKKDLLSA